MKLINVKLFLLSIGTTVILSQPVWSQGEPLAPTGATPEKLLPDGVDAAEVTNPFTKEKGFVRKGTIAAFLTNIALMDDLLSQPDSPVVREQIAALSGIMLQSIPNVKTVGLFDLFSPQEWSGSDSSKGRFIASLLYYQAYPDQVTQEIKSKVLQRLKTLDMKRLPKSMLALY